jgi:glutamyl-tRNA reductase
MAVASRRLEHAEELARTLDARPLPLEGVPGALAEFDIAVSSTASPTAVVTRAMVAAAMRGRAVQPFFFIDLAMPRNIDPGVADLPNVFLYNLDDLAKIAQENLALRQAEMTRARALLAEKAGALWQQVQPRLNGDHPPA